MWLLLVNCRHHRHHYFPVVSCQFRIRQWGTSPYKSQMSCFILIVHWTWHWVWICSANFPELFKWAGPRYVTAQVHNIPDHFYSRCSNTSGLPSLFSIVNSFPCPAASVDFFFGRSVFFRVGVGKAQVGRSSKFSTQCSRCRKITECPYDKNI